MKNKFLVLILLLVTSIFLCSCIVLPMWHKYDDLSADEITSIDIYDLRGNLNNGSGFFKEIQPVYTLNYSDHEDFLEKLSDISFTNGIIIFPPVAQDPSFYYGDWVVCINFSNGNFQFISDLGYSETYNSDNECIDSNHYGCDNEEWLALIDSFVPNEIINSPASNTSVSE